MLNWVKLGLVALAFGCALGIYQHEKHKFIDQGRAEVQKKWDDATQRAREENIKIELAKQKEANEKYDEYQVRLNQMQASNDKLNSSLERLRNTIASSKRVPTTSADQQRPIEQREVGADLLGECAGRYSDLAKEASRLAEKLNALIDQVGVIY
jgi:chromosome segregation ATPase